MKTNDCDGVILCGGFGKRLRSAAGGVPKVMVCIDGRPFLDHVIGYLKTQGVARVILCTGYKAALVEHHYREHNFGLPIDFSRETEPLGTGGALKNARGTISSNPFFVLNGDSLLPADLQALLDFHAEKNAAASMLVSRANAGKDVGRLELGDDGRITGFHEKAESGAGHWVNAGIYCFDRAVFSSMPEKAGFSLERDLFPKLVGKGFYGCRVDQEFMDIGTPERYESVKRKLEGRS